MRGTKLEGCRVIAIGGTADQVHLLVRLHPSTPVARLIAEVKGASACLLARRFASPLRWQAWNWPIRRPTRRADPQVA